MAPPRARLRAEWPAIGQVWGGLAIGLAGERQRCPAISEPAIVLVVAICRAWVGTRLVIDLALAAVDPVVEPIRSREISVGTVLALAVAITCRATASEAPLFERPVHCGVSLHCGTGLIVECQVPYLSP